MHFAVVDPVLRLKIGNTVLNTISLNWNINFSASSETEDDTPRYRNMILDFVRILCLLNNVYKVFSKMILFFFKSGLFENCCG